MAWRVVRERRTVVVLMTVVTVTGCGAAVDNRLDHFTAREVARSFEGEVELPQGEAKENHHNVAPLPSSEAARPERESSARSLFTPGLSFRWGMSYFDQNESVSSALSLAMHSMLLQRMAVELGVMMSLPSPSAQQTDSAFISGTLSWLWFMGNSQTIRPYFVLGNGVGAGNRGGEPSFGSVLINFMGGLGFDVWLTQNLGIGIDCRAFAALATDTPRSPLRGIICTAAFAFSPRSSD